MPGPKWKFLPITEKMELQSFDCGVPELNDYLKRYAGQNHRKGIGSTFVLVPFVGDQVALGYHTLSMAQVDLRFLPESQRKNLPKYPIPAVRLARLAVERHWQGKGLGELLLMDAIRRAVTAVQTVAGRYMIVDAQNKKAGEFYLRYGFHPFEGSSHSLVAAIDTLKELFIQ